MQMKDLGWNDFFESHYAPYREQDYAVARIIRENREQYIGCNDSGEFACEVTGKFRFEHASRSEFPTVGDWVVTAPVPDESKALIHGVLPRKSVFSRKVAGEITAEQPVAANVDTIFIITGLDGNYNLRRIERFLALAWDSGAVPVLLLNKSDICPETEQRKSEVEDIAAGVDVHTLSAYHRDDLDILKTYITPGKTVAFLGSSGVGKSTIINALLGTERLRVSDVSELGSRGRHTTTFRELIVLPDGGMVIDTPGMREIQVWGDDDGMERVFADIEELAGTCRFADCRHENEPGCAIRRALQDGTLDEKRYANYLKLKKEYAYLSDRQTMKASAIEKARWKDIKIYARKLKQDKKS